MGITFYNNMTITGSKAQILRFIDNEIRKNNVLGKSILELDNEFEITNKLNVLTDPIINNNYLEIEFYHDKSPARPEDIKFHEWQNKYNLNFKVVTDNDYGYETEFFVSNTDTKKNFVNDNLLLIKFEYNALSVYDKLSTVMDNGNYKLAKVYANDLKEILLMINNNNHRLTNINEMRKAIESVTQAKDIQQNPDESLSR